MRRRRVTTRRVRTHLNPNHHVATSEVHPFELGKNRIEALSDGVFAIVMTILVFNFKVPELPPDAQNVQLTPALFALWPKFVTYAVSFVSLGVFWIGHHMMYHTIRKADRALLWLNIFFFMFVSVLPFSASLVDAFLQAQIAPLFFGANIAVIGWLLFLQWAYASHRPGMTAPFCHPGSSARGKQPDSYGAGRDDPHDADLLLERRDQPGRLPAGVASLHASRKILSERIRRRIACEA